MFPSMIGLLRGALAGTVRRRARHFGFALHFGALLAVLSCAGAAGAQALQPGGPADFGAIAVGASSLNYTFTFTATVNTTVSSVVTVEEGMQDLDFVLDSQNCVGTITPPHSCNVTVTFTPSKIGLRRGAIIITDGTGAVMNEQFLEGVGLAAQLVFQPVSATNTTSLTGLTPSTFTASTAVYDGTGNLYFNDYTNGRVLKLTPANAVSLVGSFPGNTHSALAINGAGTLFLTLPTSGSVEVIRLGGTNSILPTPGLTMTAPSGIAVDGSGFIYIADSQSNRIVRIPPDFSSATVLTTPGLTTPLSSPYGLAIDHDNLYIADSGNGRIVEISINSGAATAITAVNALNQPYGISVDAAGNLVVADAGSGKILQVSSTGTVSALQPDSGQTIAAAPRNVLVTATGDIVASDATLDLVFITRSTGELTFPTATKINTLDATDGYETLTVQNSGNQAIQFSTSAPTISQPDFASGATNTCPVLGTPATPLAIGTTCTYTFGFTPSVVGPDDATVSIRGTAVGTGYAVTGTANLIGTGITPVDSLVVTATPTSTNPGSPVSFTVTAYSGTAVYTAFTGTVTFTMTDTSGIFLAGTSYTFKPSDNGTHTFPASLGAEFNTPGAYTITAHVGSVTGTSNTVTVRYNSTTTLTSTVNPVPVNGQTTLTATVAGVGTGIVPTTTVAFFSGATQVGTCTLVGGKCTFVYSPTSGGTQALTAVYAGDNNFFPSTSNAVTENVSGFSAGLTLTSSVNPSFVTQQTTLTATLTPTAGQAGAGTPTGSIAFFDGATRLGTVKLIGTTATLPATFTTVGTHTLTAVYTGDNSFAPATSAPYSQTVVAYVGSVAIVSSTYNPSYVGQLTTFTVNVTPTAGQTGAGTATGTVDIYDGTTFLGTLTLTAGTGQASFSFSSTGTHNITAHYSGDANFGAAVSAIYKQVVNSFGAQATLTSSVNPSTPGQQTTLTSTVSPQNTGNPVPTGSVTFYDGTTVIGSATLVNGVASIPASFTGGGNHNLTAVYSGNGSYGQISSAVLVQVVTLYNAQISLTSSVNPVGLNQNSLFTATISAVPGQNTTLTPTGTVTFYQDGINRGAAFIVNGVAQINLSFNSTGNHVITVVYPGDNYFNPVTSAPLVQSVVHFTAAFSLTSSINPSVQNQSTTFTFTLIPTAVQPPAPTPTGTATFRNGTTVLGTVTLVNGVATLPASFATAGNYPITVVYSGDVGYSAVTTPVLTQIVTNYAAGITLTSSINPSVVNQSTTFTATINPTAGQTGATTPTGSVTFNNGSTVLGTVKLINGSASLPSSFAVAGSYPITAVYSGDANYAAQTSAVLTQVVSSYTAAFSLTSSINPSAINQATTFTFTLTPSQTGAPTPKGTVTFKNGATVLGNANLVSGAASLPSSFASTGSYPITAVYSGDANYAAVTTPILTQIVASYTATISLTSSINPSLVNQKTTLTATVAATTGQNAPAAPTQSVTFKNGSTVLGTAQLINGVATISASFATAGSYPLTAVYSGDTNYAAVTSATVTQVVTLPASATGLNSSVNPSLVNQQTILTATVAPSATSTTVPTGTVIFYNGTTALGTATLANGVATLPASFAAAGSYPLTAVYSGDANYATSTSAVVTQLVTIATAAVSLTSSANPAFLRNTIIYTATIAGSSTSAPAPTGTVTFFVNQGAIGTSALVNGVATLPTSFVVVSTYAITAIYNGDTNYQPATSPAISQVIEDFSWILTTPASGTATVLGGHTATYTFTLAPIGGTVMAGPIAFNLTGFPANSVYAFSPPTVAAGTGVTTVTLTITPPVVQAMNQSAPLQPEPARRHTGYAPALFAFLLLPFALPFGKKRGRRPAALLLWAMLFASTLAVTGCASDASSGYYGTVQATFTLNTTATSGNLTHSASATLVRQ